MAARATAGSNVWPGLWPATLYADNSCSHHIIYFYYHYCSTFPNNSLDLTWILTPTICSLYQRSSLLLLFPILVNEKMCVLVRYSPAHHLSSLYDLFTFISTLLSHSNPSLGVIRSSLIPRRSISVALKALYAAWLWSISVEIILVSIILTSIVMQRSVQWPTVTYRSLIIHSNSLICSPMRCSESNVDWSWA